MPIKRLLRFSILFSSLFSIAAANAGTIAQCGAAICSQDFTVSSDGKTWGGGQLFYDAETGIISLGKEAHPQQGSAAVVSKGIGNSITWTGGNGNSLTVSSLFGNADPILGFALAASTGSVGGTFAFAFDLPIAIAGAIDTEAQVGYSLTSTSAAGASIRGIGGNRVVRSWDIDTAAIGYLPDLNKKVDVGYDHSHSGIGVSTRTYADTDTIIGDLAYDLMSVQIAFSLSADSHVGISGFVSQVPVPGAAWLMLTGIGFLAARRKSITV